MKKSTVVLFFVTLAAGAAFTSCSTPAEKVENAKENVAEANKDLEKANNAYLVDIENYRRESDAKIEANNQSIIEFKKRIESEKKSAREEYNKTIVDLEAKNSDMKKKMDEYKADTKENWEKFKSEFNTDMDNLGQSFKDFTTDKSKKKE